MLIETIKGNNSKPYVSLEDMIDALELELNDLKNVETTLNTNNEVVEVVEKILNSLISMKKQYYKKLKKH